MSINPTVLDACCGGRMMCKVIEGEQYNERQNQAGDRDGISVGGLSYENDPTVG
jgi:hypothetical protein